MRRCRPLLGTFVEIDCDRPATIELAFDAIARVHRLMSAHEPDSDVSRVNRFAHLEPIRVDDWTVQVLERALWWSKRSAGGFDVVRAGRIAMARGLLPRHPDQPLPLAPNWTLLELQGPMVGLLKPGCIDLGGLAKGFAVDRGVEALRQAGCERGLVNAGGDLRVFGPQPWSVEIAHPTSRQPIAAVDVQDAAFATSAGVARGIDLLSFDHLGDGERRWLSVSVLARTACDADALTKIVWKRGDDAAALLGDAGARALALTRHGRITPIGEAARVAA